MGSTVRICNQVMDNETEGLKCQVCGETSEIVRVPIELSKFTDQLEAFKKVHDAKGCNDTHFRNPPPKN